MKIAFPILLIPSVLFLSGCATTQVNLESEPHSGYEVYYNGKPVGKTPCRFKTANSPVFGSEKEHNIQFARSGRIVGSTTLEEEYKWKNICLFGWLYGIGFFFGRGPVPDQMFYVDPIDNTITYREKGKISSTQSKGDRGLSTVNRIAVMDFIPKGVPVTMAQNISELIRAELINSNTCIVIERAQMGSLLREQGFQQTGCTDVSCAVQVGKLLSAQKILIGTVMKMGNSLIITGRIVDVEKGVDRAPRMRR